MGGKRNALAIMARTPVLHHTKTRLATKLGAQGALAAHVEMVESTLSRLHSIATEIDVSLWVTEVESVSEAWAQKFGFALYRQKGCGLGTRMEHILSSLLASGAKAACLVGTDCPNIDTGYVAAAFAALEETPIVFGPAEDGGYGLVGVTQPTPGLFSKIPWGTDRVMQDSRKSALNLGLAVSELPLIWDVDTPSDWQRYLSWKAAHQD